MNKSNNNSNKESADYAKIFSSGFTVVATIGLGGFLGWMLDKLFQTDYWIIIGIVGFTLLAVLNFFRILMRIK